MARVLSQLGMIHVTFNGVNYYPLYPESMFYLDNKVSVTPIYNKVCPKYVKVQSGSHWELWKKGRPYDS